MTRTGEIATAFTKPRNDGMECRGDFFLSFRVSVKPPYLALSIRIGVTVAPRAVIPRRGIMPRRGNLFYIKTEE